MLPKSIEIKEIVALSRSLLALRENVRDARVDAVVDNKILCDTWERQHSRSSSVLLVLKELFWTTVELNLSLHLHYVPSHQNPADLPSRRLNLSDSKLSPRLWSALQTKFGGSRGHSIDLLSLNSNVQQDLNGAPLPFFSPTPSSYAAGVNVFAQHISFADNSPFENCYAFPPFVLIGPLINFLRQEKARCTLVVPDISPRKYWWPIVQTECSEQFLLAARGQSGALLRPGKSGFVEFGSLPWNLYAFQLRYDEPSSIPAIQDKPVTEGRNVTLTCQASGMPHPMVSWIKPDDPAKIVKLTSEYEIAAGQSVSLHCQAEGNPKPTYTWTPCESVCHESTLNIPGVVSDGIYTCKVTNGLGSDTKHTSVVIASTLINVTLTITSERCNDGKYNQSLLWRKLNETIKEVFASESGYNSARLVNVRYVSNPFEID
ncbi:hypothetical protein OS493_031152 [Desmophyllum pertusum]|uniref:Ig-like domain-containing protein n=1 Tax=Desmophyllum pertusum TaxID=174260 RepID=A0A9W9ZXX1_9CNID|nr:hypothetical protein OS493_031152 [Desmophyllum pertusum]